VAATNVRNLTWLADSEAVRRPLIAKRQQRRPALDGIEDFERIEVLRWLQRGE
jgi:hypothetical protein